MRNEDDRESLIPQTINDAVKPLALGLSERRRGLVHDQNTVLRFKRPHDLDQLLTGNRQGSRARIGVERHAEAIGQFAETPDRGAMVEERTPGLLPAEEDIGRG